MPCSPPRVSPGSCWKAWKAASGSLATPSSATGRRRCRWTRAAPKPDVNGATWRSNVSRGHFESMVDAAKEHILAGDVFQVVLSQRFTKRLGARPVDVYRCLRGINPSPYMYYLCLGGDRHVVGTSPEVLVRVEGDQVTTRPLAGTRRRGATEEQDRELESELLADSKERAEHVMLVELGRND